VRGMAAVSPAGAGLSIKRAASPLFLFFFLQTPQFISQWPISHTGHKVP
jgi:hypothetical protein